MKINKNETNPLQNIVSKCLVEDANPCRMWVGLLLVAILSVLILAPIVVLS